MDNTNKPLWLEALEKQSWQAELIVSGLVIYGSISAGPWIDKGVIYMSTIFSDRILDFMSLLLTYIYLIYALIIVCFISHLVLRIEARNQNRNRVSK